MIVPMRQELLAGEHGCLMQVPAARRHELQSPLSRSAAKSTGPADGEFPYMIFAAMVGDVAVGELVDAGLRSKADWEVSLATDIYVAKLTAQDLADRLVDGGRWFRSVDSGAHRAGLIHSARCAMDVIDPIVACLAIVELKRITDVDFGKDFDEVSGLADEWLSDAKNGEMYRRRAGRTLRQIVAVNAPRLEILEPGDL